MRNRILPGALHALEHASAPASVYSEKDANPERKPSPRDVRVSQVLLGCMMAHFKTLPIPNKHLARGDTLKDFEMLRGEMDTLNVWVPEMQGKMAKFGNEKQFYLLARTLDRRIIVLHGPTMAWLRNRRNANTTAVQARTPRHALYTPTTKSLRPHDINEVRVLHELESYPDTLVIQHDGELHYMCLRRSKKDDDVELPRALAAVLAEPTPE